MFIYEIELHGVPLGNNEYINAKYVGSTTQTPGQRFDEHKGGGRRSNKFAQYYGFDFSSHVPSGITSKKGLEKYEQEYAEELRQGGHYVFSGLDAYKDKPIACPDCGSKSLMIACLEESRQPYIKCRRRACLFTSYDKESVKNILCGHYDKFRIYRYRKIFDKEKLKLHNDETRRKNKILRKASQDSERQREQAYLHKVNKKSEDGSWVSLVVGGLYLTAIIFSDKRLKEDIKKIGESPSGINIYTFRYKGKNKLYRGVIAQEVPWAKILDPSGFYKVDYSKIDVDFIEVKMELHEDNLKNIDEILIKISSGEYDSDELEIVFNQGTKSIYILDITSNQKLYEQPFSSLLGAKQIAEHIGLKVVKQIKTQINFFNVDGSKRGYKNTISNKTKGVKDDRRKLLRSNE